MEKMSPFNPKTEEEFQAMMKNIKEQLSKWIAKCQNLSTKVQGVLDTKKLSKSQKEMFSYVKEEAEASKQSATETLDEFNSPGSEYTFASFQWYANAARDSKRISDIIALNSKITMMSVNGDDLLKIVNRMSSRELQDAKIGGIPLTPWQNYVVGTPNYEIMGIIKDNFQDPTGGEYIIAIAKLPNGEYQYQVLATLENNNDPKAKVVWWYTPREETKIEMTIPVGNTIELNYQDITKIKKGYHITIEGATPKENIVKNISRDWTTVTFETSITKAGTAIIIPGDVKWLIKDEKTGLPIE